jgi:hypothetical protein
MTWEAIVPEFITCTTCENDNLKHMLDLPAIFIPQMKGGYTIWVAIEHLVSCLLNLNQSVKTRPNHNIKEREIDDLNIRYTQYYHILDLTNTDLPSYIKFIKDISQQQNIVYKRPIIVLNILEQLRDIGRVESAINKYCANICFIVVSHKNSFIPPNIRQVCTTLKFSFDFHSYAKQILVEKGKEGWLVHIDQLDELASGCPYNLSMLMELEHPDQYIDLTRILFQKQIDLLVAKYKHNKTTILSYGECLRAFVLKISAACISISRACELILEVANNTYPKSTENIVHLLAEMEFYTNLSSKEIFSLEYYLNEIISCLAKGT